MGGIPRNPPGQLRSHEAVPSFGSAAGCGIEQRSGLAQPARSLQQELQACEHQQNHVYQSLASGGVDEESRDALLDELETLQESILDLRRRIEQGATVDKAQLQW